MRVIECRDMPTAMRQTCPLPDHIPEWNKHSVNTPADERKAIVEARRRACEGCEHRAAKPKQPLTRPQAATTINECPECQGRLCCGGSACNRCGWTRQ